MAELNAVKLTDDEDEVWRFPDGFKNAFSPVKVIRKRNGNITPYQDKTFNPLTPTSDQHLISPYHTTPESNI